MIFGTWPRTTRRGARLTSALLTLSICVLQACSRNLNLIQSRASMSTQATPGITSDTGHFYDPAAPQTGPLPQRNQGDAPWTQSEASYKKAISCPRGAQTNVISKGIVLLVPGTGGDASEAYESSPYYHLLPAQGFNVCWVNTPNYSLGDMQLSAEFVAYAIQSLASKSTSSGGKINVVSYSQGGPNVQWASTFWPSIRKFVIGHIALAPPMKGTASALLLCPISRLVGGCQPSVLQQSVGSAYMKAANSLSDRQSGAYALIPTTIIFSTTDEVVTPQVGPDASSRLIGSKNIGIQSICGLTHIVEHFTILGDLGAYGIALDALKNGRPAQESSIDRSYCYKTAESLGFSVGNLGNDLKYAFRTALGDPAMGALTPSLKKLRVTREPPLQQYVCDRGYATSCTRNGFNNKPAQGQMLEADDFAWERIWNRSIQAVTAEDIRVI